MTIERTKFLAAIMGCSAVVAAVVVTSGVAPDQHAVAGGSGASATGTTYVQPTISAMKLASTTTETPAQGNDDAPTALATPMASPSVKATPAAGCVNNGQCP